MDADTLVAWGTLGTAVFTGGLVVFAWFAWRTAKRTLIEQSRPYVFVEIIPGMSGSGAYDVRVSNAGRSSAKNLTLTYDQWPSNLDDVGTAVRTLFDTPRTLPPGCSIRSIWRLTGNFTDGRNEAGAGVSGTIRATYNDSSEKRAVEYSDQYDVQIDTSGLWPMPTGGPEPGDKVTGEALKFYKLGQALIRSVGELGR